MTCEKCGGELVVGSWPFCPHGFGHNSVQDDTIIGGFWQENFGPTPEYFESKKAMAQRAKELKLEPFVRHKGVEGTDKSPHTTRWI